MELVVAISKRKLASIDVIGVEEIPFQRVLGKEIGAGIQKVFHFFPYLDITIESLFQYHESLGVKFHMSSKIEKIVPQEKNPNFAGGVVVNGTTLPCDMVIMGVGVAPATGFLKGSGIVLEKDGGVRVDEYLKVRSAPSGDVYAIGDIAIYPQQDGSEMRIEHWNVCDVYQYSVVLSDRSWS